MSMEHLDNVFPTAESLKGEFHMPANSGARISCRRGNGGRSSANLMSGRLFGSVGEGLCLCAVDSLPLSCRVDLAARRRIAATSMGRLQCGAGILRQLSAGGDIQGKGAVAEIRGLTPRHSAGMRRR